MIVDPKKVEKILAKCAQEFILPRYKQLEDHEVSTKTGPRDLVTQADLDVEDHLKRTLPDVLTGSVVVGEEGVAQGIDSLDVLHDTSQKIWVVDPVDGTHNFVHHGREFGILLACVIEGITQYSWVYDVLGESCAIAEKGSGAFWEDKRMEVVPKTDISDLSGFINIRYFPKKYRADIEQALEQFNQWESLHCAAHEYLRIASGEAQFAVYSRMKPWDHLAGALLVEEAGGAVLTWENETYKPQDHETGLIAAASQENRDQVFDALLKHHL